MAEAVLEGFICPMCKEDLGAADQLLSHFQEEHSEEQALIKTFKDLLDKAKKKILKPGTSPEHGISATSTTSGYSYDYSDVPQDIGLIVSHTKFYEKIRSEKVQRLAILTNQLIIRLEKLLENMPTDPLKKKVHEQNIVPWLDGTVVSRCPNCAGVFHLAKRQHHCRICGGIMCSDCSHFMSIDTARYILDKPAVDEEPHHNNIDRQLRLCVPCITLLEIRRQIRENLTVKPLISQYYEKYSELKKQADEFYITYYKMCTSLNAGESNYNLHDAQVLRVKLLRIAESIDTVSSKIAFLGTKDADNPPQGQALRLQNAVRSAATSYLRSQLLNLPVLPTEEQFEEAQLRRRQEATNRIQEEKRRQARLQNNSVSAKPVGTHQRTPSSTDSAVSLGQSWIPEKKKVHKMEDPFLEQMHIIRSYIMEAQAANKTDVVASLEANLEELKKEYWKKLDTDKYTEVFSRSGDSSEAGSLGSFEESRTSLDNNHGDFYN